MLWKTGQPITFEPEHWDWWLKHVQMTRLMNHGIDSWFLEKFIQVMVLSACEVVRLGLWWKIGIWFSAPNFSSRFHLPINEVSFWSPWLGLSAQYLNDAITHVLTELCTKNWKWTFWGKFWLVRTKKGSLTLGLRILRDQNFDLVTNLHHHRRIYEYFDQKASLWAIGNFPDFGKFPKLLLAFVWENFGLWGFISQPKINFFWNQDSSTLFMHKLVKFLKTPRLNVPHQQAGQPPKNSSFWLLSFTHVKFFEMFFARLVER